MINELRERCICKDLLDTLVCSCFKIDSKFKKANQWEKLRWLYFDGYVLLRGYISYSLPNHLVGRRRIEYCQRLG